MTNKWFPKIDSSESAKDATKQGAYGVLIFTAMNIIGLVFIYLAEKNPIDGSATTHDDLINQIIGTIILIPILLITAWRIYKGKGWVASIIVLIWFIAETALKVLGGTTNIFWVIAYIAVAGMILNGFRGCWYFRKHVISKQSSTT